MSELTEERVREIIREELQRFGASSGPAGVLPLGPGPVEVVFDTWRTTFNHPKAVLDKKRRRTIEYALVLYSAEHLQASIRGYKNSPHHMGQNANGTVYDDISLMLRDAAHIDQGLRFLNRPAHNESEIERSRRELRELSAERRRLLPERTRD